MLGENGAFSGSVQGIPALSLKRCDGRLSPECSAVFSFSVIAVRGIEGK